MSIEDELREHLRASADRIEVPAAAVPAKRRPRRLVPALAAAAVVVATVGGAALLVGGDRPGPAPVDATLGTSAPAPGVTGPVSLELQRATFEAPLGLDQGPLLVTAVADGYLALASEDGPGIRVWTSPDGAAWSVQEGAFPAGEAALWLTRLVPAGGRALAVAEEFPLGEPGAPLDATSGRIAVYATSDGLTWDRRPLPLPEIEDLGPFEYVTVTIEDAVGGPAGAVIRGIAFTQIDVEAVARERFGLEPDQIDGWMTDEERVEITRTDGATVHVTYDELGISRTPGEVDLATRLLWHTVDGDSWSLVEDVPLLALDMRAAGAATAEGFVAAGFDESGPAMLTSPDGRTWTALDLGRFGDVGEILGVAGDGYSAVAVTRMRDGSLMAWTSPDGTTWSRLLELPVGTGSVDVGELAVGPLGIVVTLVEYDDGPAPDMPDINVIEKDGLVLTFDFGASRLTLVDGATGEVLVDETVDFDREIPPEFVDVSEEDGQVTINHPDTGEPLLTYGPEEAMSGSEQVLESAEAAADSFAVSTWHIGAETWQPLAVPEGAILMSIAVGSDEIVISLIDPELGINAGPQVWRAAPAG